MAGRSAGAPGSLLYWLGGRKGIRLWWVAGVVICLERGADLHMAQLMPPPLAVSCFCKIQIGFTFLVPAHPGNSGIAGPLAALGGGQICRSFVLGFV